MKKILLLSMAMMFGVFVLSVGSASAQLPQEPPVGIASEEDSEEPSVGFASALISEDMQRQIKLMSVLMNGMVQTPGFLDDFHRENVNSDEMGGITPEQLEQFRLLTLKKYEVFETEMREKFGGPGDITQDQLGGVAETLASMFPKINDTYRETMEEMFSAETVKQMDTISFQAFGGVFGGALSVGNLATLNLTDEQKEMAAKIVEQQNRERIELMYSIRINVRPEEGQDMEKLMKDMLDEIIALTRRGQQEIEKLLTPAQKRLADELMAAAPEKYRFLNDFLDNRPWRLNGTRWQPGDGPPPNLNNYPGEMRRERVPGVRQFPGN